MVDLEVVSPLVMVGMRLGITARDGSGIRVVHCGVTGIPQPNRKSSHLSNLFS